MSGGVGRVMAVGELGNHPIPRVDVAFIESVPAFADDLGLAVGQVQVFDVEAEQFACPSGGGVGQRPKRPLAQVVGRSRQCPQFGVGMAWAWRSAVRLRRALRRRILTAGDTTSRSRSTHRERTTPKVASYRLKVAEATCAYRQGGPPAGRLTAATGTSAPRSRSAVQGRGVHRHCGRHEVGAGEHPPCGEVAPNVWVEATPRV
jgi:hypothetical protein